jgi:hypothetical protein
MGGTLIDESDRTARSLERKGGGEEGESSSDPRGESSVKAQGTKFKCFLL